MNEAWAFVAMTVFWLGLYFALGAINDTLQRIEDELKRKGPR